MDLKNQRGRMQIMTMLLLLGLTVGVYLFVVYTPIYLDHFNAKSKCDETVKSTWRMEDENKTREMLHRLVEKVVTVKEMQGDEEVSVPGIDPQDEDTDVEIDRTQTPPLLIVDFAYSRVIKFPLIKKERLSWFKVHCEQKLEEIHY